MKTQEQAAAPLLEMMISILILAIAGVICLRVFAAARFTGILSRDKINAMNRVQNAIEMAENADSTRFFDENWSECGPSDAVFVLSVSYNEADGTAVCRRIEPYPFLDGDAAELCTITFAAGRDA